MLLIRLFFGGLIKRVIGAFTGFFSWARQNPAWALLIVGALVSALWIWHVTGQRDDARQRLAATQKAFDETVENYQRAAADAETIQAENLANVAKQYEDNANDEIAQYQSSAADYRGRFERLRAARRNQSGAGQTDLPAVPDPSGGTPPADHNPGQPSDPEMIAIRIDDLETLVKGALQGEAIRNLWLSNEDVGTSPESNEE